MGIRRLDSRHRTLIQRRARDSRYGLFDYQCGNKSKWGDRGAVPCAVSGAGEGRVGILGELWYVIAVRGSRRERGAKEWASCYNIEGDTGDVLVCDPDGQWR